MRRLGIFAAVLALALVTGCEAVAEKAAPRSTDPAVVPNVVGKRLSTAHDTLSDAGFASKDKDATPLDRDIIEASNWIVRSQKPAGGTNVSKATDIILSVDKPTDVGSVTITVGVVPNVICRNYSAARNLLTAAGFEEIRAFDATEQARHIVAEENWVVTGQTVAPGKRIAATERIVLKVVKYGEKATGSRCAT